MSDQEDDKKISNDEVSSSENENQSKVDEKNQPEDVKIDNEATSSEENPENHGQIHGNCWYHSPLHTLLALTPPPPPLRLL